MTAVFVDLPPESTLAATMLLNRRGYIVVPVIQRWAVPSAVVGCKVLLERLVGLANDVHLPTGWVGVVFVLDGRRFGVSPRGTHGVGKFPGQRRFDNRYEYPVCRFPPPELLVQAGVTEVRWVPETVAPDMLAYAARLSTAGLTPEQVPQQVGAS
jgi:hypothetical protein